jgi:manganese/zinc/iron transport system substrate-binding protein
MKQSSSKWQPWKHRILVVAMGLGLVGCEQRSSSAGGSEKTTTLPLVVTTTTMVTELVRQVAGENVEIHALMGPGVDPHLYRPTPEDVDKIAKARLIIYNGLDLEGKMVDVFRKFERQEKLTLALASGLSASELIKASPSEMDPHIWGDASLWAQTIPDLATALAKVVPSRKEEFERNGLEVQKRLVETHAWLKKAVEGLPRRNRVLITSHDAFRYFGRAYGLEVMGVQGVSTDSEAGLGDVARIVDVVKQKSVRAIFIESSVSPATIQRISQDSGVIIGGELLSDALSTPGDLVKVGEGQMVDRGTLEGMLKANMHTIVTALQQ